MAGLIGSMALGHEIGRRSNNVPESDVLDAKGAMVREQFGYILLPEADDCEREALRSIFEGTINGQPSSELQMARTSREGTMTVLDAQCGSADSMERADLATAAVSQFEYSEDLRQVYLNKQEASVYEMDERILFTALGGLAMALPATLALAFRKRSGQPRPAEVEAPREEAVVS